MAHLPSNVRKRREESRARMLEDAPTDTPWLNGDECAKKGEEGVERSVANRRLSPFSISNPPTGMQMMYPSLGGYPSLLRKTP